MFATTTRSLLLFISDSLELGQQTKYVGGGGDLPLANFELYFLANVHISTLMYIVYI